MNDRRRSQASPLRFFVLVFALSVPFWLVGGMYWAESVAVPVNLPISSLMAGCPMLAAAALAHHENGMRGVRKLVGNAFRHPVLQPKVWYLPALLIMPVIMLVSYGVMRVLRMPLPDPRLSLPTVLAMIVVFFVSAVTEELGWMGYAAGPLLKRHTALTAGLFLGVVWALWHVVPYRQAGHSASWIACQCVFTVAARVLMVWIYNNVGRNVLATVLFHAMINVSVFSFPNYGSHYDPAITAAVTVATAIVVTLIWGPARLTRGAGKAAVNEAVNGAVNGDRNSESLRSPGRIRQ